MKLEALRREYLHGGLRRADLDADPIRQFERWLQQAIELQINDPTAMVLASVDAAGQPSQRIVLLKGVDENGFCFYTNYASRKGQQIAHNAQVSLLFPWHALDRQVRVCGSAERLPREDSAAYFAARPRDSQLAAWASAQSQAIDSREPLMNALTEMKERFADSDVPLPDSWGGFRVRPSSLEFWQGGEHRLHDRFEYRRQQGGGWQIQRLAP